MPSDSGYIIISSAYNEIDVVSKTVGSVVKQTVLPLQWIIVDDDSTDGTFQHLINITKNLRWITVVKKQKSVGEFGEHVAQNFNFGFSYIKNVEYEFLVKLDMDISIDRADYFEYQILQMKKNARLGISSGITYFFDGGEKRIVSHPVWRTTGAMKFYRRQCFSDIGGIAPIYGWDGLDDIKARYNRWETRTFFELEVNHLKKHRDLNRQKSKLIIAQKAKSYYQRGYSIFFIILKFLPILNNQGAGQAFIFIKEFIKNKISGEPKYVSPAEEKFLRRFQIKRVLNLID